MSSEPPPETHPQPCGSAASTQQQASMHFTANVHSAARARAFIAEHCRAWGIPQAITDAELVASELVENAVLHGKTGGRITAETSGGELCITVRDGSTAPPRVACPRPTTPGGRGLLLIERLCEDWGFRLTDDGKVVWAVLRVPTVPGVPEAPESVQRHGD